MIEKFKENFISLNKIFTSREIIDYLIDKKAFNEEFIKMIYESCELTKLTNIRKNKTKNYKLKNYKFNISDIDNNYQISYDNKKKKIIVNISDSNLFSYYDNKNDLITKLNHYISNEDYEKAQILHNFIKNIDNN